MNSSPDAEAGMPFCSIVGVRLRLYDPGNDRAVRKRDRKNHRELQEFFYPELKNLDFFPRWLYTRVWTNHCVCSVEFIPLAKTCTVVARIEATK
jgi:hypothetical protein